MKRRDFFRSTAITTVGAALLSPFKSIADNVTLNPEHSTGKTAKNIIFLVSDGMSNGTLSMANMLSERKFGKLCEWISLYHRNVVNRGLMDTASASNLVTDSAAAC